MVYLKLTDAQGRLLQRYLEGSQEKFAAPLLADIEHQIRYGSPGDETDEEEARANFEFFGQDQSELMEREKQDVADYVASEE